jgi:hypothetical protein
VEAKRLLKSEAEAVAGPGQEGTRNVQPELRRDAMRVLAQLQPEEREALIIQCWMSHDARWFTAAAAMFGLEAAQRLNQVAVREEGRAEARRLGKRLALPPVRTIRDYLLVQETIIGLLGPELLDYTIEARGQHGFDLGIERCFAYDNVCRAGIQQQYECGILPRIIGWLDEFGLAYQLSPEPAKCLKAQGRECKYLFRRMRRLG